MAATREAPTLATPDPAPTEALYPKLTPGPGRSAQEVASHQRSRLYGAMIEIVGERGYGAVTVRELTRLAGVSTRSFYAHFKDKEDCFLRTYEFVAREAAARVVTAQRSERDWREQLRAGSLAYAHSLADHPQAARLAMVEALTAGPAALERTRSAECMFERLIAESFARAPDRIEVPPILVEGIAAGVEGVVRTRLLAGRERELPDLVDDLIEWALCFRNEAAAEVTRLDGRSAPIPSCPPGENGSSNGRVVGDERERILAAVAKLAAVDGYGELTVTRIRSEAGVSRRCFDAHFEGVADCFLTALEQRVEHVLSQAVLAAADDTWAIGVHRAICSLCATAARDPALAKLAFAEILAPGPDGLRCRERLITKIAELLRQSAWPSQRPSELAVEASAAAVWGVVHHRCVSGRASHLPRMVSPLSFLALTPAIGTSAAAGAINDKSSQPEKEASHA